MSPAPSFSAVMYKVYRMFTLKPIVLPNNRSEVLRYAVLSNSVGFLMVAFIPCRLRLCRGELDERIASGAVVRMLPIRHDLHAEIEQTGFAPEEIDIVIPVLEPHLMSVSVGAGECRIKTALSMHVAPDVAQQIVDVLGRHVRKHSRGPDHVEPPVAEYGKQARLDPVQLGSLGQEIVSRQTTPAFREHLGRNVYTDILARL